MASDSEVEERYESYLSELPAEERWYLENVAMRHNVSTLPKLKNKKDLPRWKGAIQAEINSTNIKGVMDGTEKPPQAEADEGLKRAYRIRRMKAMLMILASLDENVLSKMESRGYRDNFRDLDPKRLFEFACMTFEKIGDKSKSGSGNTRITPRGSVTKPSSKPGICACQKSQDCIDIEMMALPRPRVSIRREST